MPDASSVVPYMLHRDEVKNRRPRTSNWGIRVTFSSGVVHFFPGGSIQEASALLVLIPDELRNHPQTKIEYGEKTGPGWATQKTLKHPTVV